MKYLFLFHYYILLLLLLLLLLILLLYFSSYYLHYKNLIKSASRCIPHLLCAGRQREPTVKTLRSPLAEIWRHCVLSGRTQHATQRRALPRGNEIYITFSSSSSSSNGLYSSEILYLIGIFLLIYVITFKKLIKWTFRKTNHLLIFSSSFRINIMNKIK